MIKSNFTIIGSLVLSSCLSIFLVVARIYYTHHISYFFLLWNLFLAWIPFLLALLLQHLDHRNAYAWLKGIIFFCWLLFFPNAPYILTDLFHLHERYPIPLWYDMVLLLSFIWNGLCLGFQSLFIIEQCIGKRLVYWKRKILVSFLLFLCSYGIYLGRFQRWNSWDVLSNPFDLFLSIWQELIHPRQHPKMMVVSFLYAILLLSIYTVLCSMRMPHVSKSKNTRALS